MKHSIKRQMTAVFIGMIVFFLLTFFAINLNFLEPYYISNKETQFIRMYGELRAAVEGDLLEDETMSSFLYRTAEKNNISFLVVDDMRGRVEIGRASCRERVSLAV